MSITKILDKFSKNSAHTVNVQCFDSPVEKVYAAADDEYLYLLTFEDSKNFEKRFELVSKELKCKYVVESNKILDKLKSELTDYFDGKLKKFTVPIKTFGSEFQKEVWDKLLELPYASTQTYGDLASALGRNASHARAIGAACGANNHLLVIPCHRLVASGSKGGYSDGINRKEWLLDHEKKYAD